MEKVPQETAAYLASRGLWVSALRSDRRPNKTLSFMIRWQNALFCWCCRPTLVGLINRQQCVFRPVP